MDNKYENIVPWNGAQDTGRDVRLKLDRNFDRIKTNFEELLNELKKKLSNSEPDEAAEVIAFLKGLKVSDSLISRLLLRDTEVDELLDTDIMSALRVMAEIYENNDNLEKLFLSKVKKDRAAEHITFEKGGTAENGFIVRLPKQNTPASLMSCLLEEDIDTLIEEDEDAIVELSAETSDLSFGDLNNVNSAVDIAPIGSLPVMGQNEWSYVAPTLFSGSIDEDNMLIPVYDKRIQKMVFVPISVIKGGVTPPSSGFPYTFSFALV
jgi:NAD-specific glutamate dehydrogenase